MRLCGTRCGCCPAVPKRPPRVCPKCRRAVQGRCTHCYPAWHGSSSPPSTARWRRLRSLKLDANPQCEADGCPYPAVEVDHKVPQSVAPQRRYDWTNLQSLCKDCHGIKTRLEALVGRGITPDPDTVPDWVRRSWADWLSHDDSPSHTPDEPEWLVLED